MRPASVFKPFPPEAPSRSPPAHLRLCENLLSWQRELNCSVGRPVPRPSLLFRAIRLKLALQRCTSSVQSGSLREKSRLLVRKHRVHVVVCRSIAALVVEQSRYTCYLQREMNNNISSRSHSSVPRTVLEARHLPASARRWLVFASRVDCLLWYVVSTSRLSNPRVCVDSATISCDKHDIGNSRYSLFAARHRSRRHSAIASHWCLLCVVYCCL